VASQNFVTRPGSQFVQSGTGAVERTVESKLQDVVSVKDFGAVGDGVTNDQPALQAAASAAIAAGARLWIPKTSSFYAVPSGGILVTLADGQGLVIESDGAELRRTTNVGGTLIRANCSSAETAAVGTKTFCTVRGLVLDGRGVPEQWSETNFNNLKTITGIATSAEYVVVENCRFNKIYGYGINSGGAYQSQIFGCSFLEVGGHWYQNDTYDSFGDGVYHRTVKENANVLISKCSIIGYTSNYSRIGVTLEFSPGVTYDCTVEDCYIQKYDRAVHVEEDSKVRLTIRNCKLVDFRVGVFLYGSMVDAQIKIVDSYLKYGTGNYNGSQGWTTCFSSSAPIEIHSSTLTLGATGFTSNAGPNARYYDCVFDYKSIPCILSNHTAWFSSCDFKGIVAPGGNNHHFFGGSQRFRSCRFYGTTNASFNRDSGTNFDEVIDCISYGPVLSNANLISNLEYSGFTPTSSLLGSGIRVTNGTTRYLASFFNIFPNVDGSIGIGGGGTNSAPRTFTASSTTIPSSIWVNQAKATIIVKFSDGSASFNMSEGMFLNPSGYGQGYYIANIKKNTSGVWVADGAVVTKGDPAVAGLQGTTSDSLTWTATGAYSFTCQVLLVPQGYTNFLPA
jgi:hypothetical protein